MNRKVNLTKRFRTPKGLSFCPADISANGRLKPDYAYVGDKMERHPEGACYLEWYEGSRRIRRSVGKDAVTALVRRHRQEQILAGKAAGIKLAEEGKSEGLLEGSSPKSLPPISTGVCICNLWHQQSRKPSRRLRLLPSN
jgi:hypothetical protein